MQMFHITNISVHPAGIGTIAERLIDTLSVRNIPGFRVDHFNNFADGIFIVLSELGATPGFIKDAKVEVEDAVVSVKNEFRLEHFSGHWLSPIY